MSIVLRKQGNSPGYQVAVRINGRRLTRFFGFRSHGGERSARRKAGLCESSLLTMARTSRGNRRETPGDTGVYRYLRRETKRDKEYIYDTVQAVWWENGVRRSTSFHVDKHGAEGAFSLARESVNQRSHSRKTS